MIAAHNAAIPKRNVFANAHFRVEPCASCPIAWLPYRQSASSRLFGCGALSGCARSSGRHPRNHDAGDRERCSPTPRLLCAFCRGVWLGSFPSISSLGLAANFLCTRSPARHRHIRSTTARLGTIQLSPCSGRLRASYLSYLSCTAPIAAATRWAAR